MIEAKSHIQRNGRCVAVGGGHKVASHELPYQEAMMLGRWLAERGVAVRSGGYGGIMEAISKGAALGGGKVFGVGLVGWTLEKRNEFVPPENYTESISLAQRVEETFWNADAIVFFKGGVGTLHELAVAWAGKIMRFIPASTPLILVGEQWNGVLASLTEHMQVFQQHKEYLVIVPDVETLIRDGILDKPFEQGQKEHDRKRWDKAASSWDQAISDPKHFANLENGYERFNRFLLTVLENRVWPKDSIQLLDLGCGTGAATLSLRSSTLPAKDWIVDGLDFAPEMVKAAKSLKVFRNVHQLSAEQLGEIKDEYHVMFSRGVILSRFTESQLKEVLQALHSHLADGGLLVFDFLNSILDDALPTGGKTRLLFSNLRAMLHDTGFRVSDVEGLGNRTFNVACIKLPRGTPQVKLITSNPDKYRALIPLLREHRIELFAWQGEVKEIQSADLEVVSNVKAQHLYEQLHTALIVDDVALSLDAYPHFPGTMTKQVLQTIKLGGVQKLLAGKSHAATLRCMVTVWLDDARHAQFCGSVRGILDFSSAQDSNLPLNSVFIPEGQKATLGQIEKSDPLFSTHRAQALRAACAWLQKTTVL